jgi:hypothetical protein
MLDSRMLQRFVAFAFVAALAVAECFTVTAVHKPAAAVRAPAVRVAPAPAMIEPSAIDAASSLLALGIPIPAFTPAKAFISVCSRPELQACILFVTAPHCSYARYADGVCRSRSDFLQRPRYLHHVHSGQVARGWHAARRDGRELWTHVAAVGRVTRAYCGRRGHILGCQAGGFPGV